MTALVLGGAACVWDDIQNARKLGKFAGTVACNDMIADWPGELYAAVSLHPDQLKEWVAARAAKGFSPPAHIWAGEKGNPGIASRLNGQKTGGSSGLFAVKVALVDCGFDRAVCCGIPMNDDGAHYLRDEPWKSAAYFRASWLEALEFLEHRVRSMSGWTQALLGTPTAAWVAGL